MERYEHRQTATWLTALLLGSALGAGALALAVAAESTAGAVVAGAVAFVVLLAAWIFRSLRVRVGDTHVEVAFGSGWPRRSIALAEIESAEPVRNRWWYGWGIRFTPHGWLWNLSGLDAVELRRRGGKRFRIGTDDPEGLAGAIRAGLPVS
jgi:hypothetical protein